jgi:hypothetical protein
MLKTAVSTNERCEWLHKVLVATDLKQLHFQFLMMCVEKTSAVTALCKAIQAARFSLPIAASPRRRPSSCRVPSVRVDANKLKYG